MSLRLYDPPLMPKTPVARDRVRLYNKLIDEYKHNACTIMTFATAFRPRFLKMRRKQWLAEINKAPLKRRAEYKRSVIERGLDSEFVADALGQHQKMISWMADNLKRGPYLAGDAFSLADCWARVRERPSVNATIFDRMKEADWAPFKNLTTDPSAKVQQMLKAA